MKPTLCLLLVAGNVLAQSTSAPSGAVIAQATPLVASTAPAPGKTPVAPAPSKPVPTPAASSQPLEAGPVLPSGAVAPGFRQDEPIGDVTNPFADSVQSSTGAWDPTTAAGKVQAEVTGLVYQPNGPRLLYVNGKPVRVGETVPIGGEEYRLEDVRKGSATFHAPGGLLTVPLALNRRLPPKASPNAMEISRIMCNGVFLTGQGLMVTAYQNIQDARSILVRSEGATLEARLLHTLDKLGLAVLSIPQSVRPVAAVPENWQPVSGIRLYAVTNMRSEREVSNTPLCFELVTGLNTDLNASFVQLASTLPLAVAGSPVYTNTGQLVGVLVPDLDRRIVNRIAKHASVMRALQEIPGVPKLLNVGETEPGTTKYINNHLPLVSITVSEKM